MAHKRTTDLIARLSQALLGDQSARMNPFTLSFSGDTEPAFRAASFRQSIRQVRAGLLLGLALYGIFGFLDAALLPESRDKLWLIRYGLVCPSILLGLLFSFAPQFRRFMQGALAALMVLCGLGIIGMIAIAPPPVGFSYYAGLILVFMLGYTFLRIRFIWTSLANWILVACYEVVAIWVSRTPTYVLLNNSAFFVAANLIGMVACYSIELNERRSFVLTRLLEQQQDRVRTANRELQVSNEALERRVARGTQALHGQLAGRRRAEEAHLRLVAAVEQTAEAIVLLNDVGRIQYVNPAFIEITGYKQTEAVGLAPQMIGGHAPDTTQYQEMWRALASGKAWAGELTGIRKDGSTYEAELTISAIRDEQAGIAGYVIILRDVTQRAALQAQLRQSQKMEAVGQLAGGVAHDFNNLLTALMGYMELISASLPGDSPLHEDVGQVQRIADRAAALNRQLLAFSRRQVLEPRVLSLNDVIADMQKMLRRLIREDIELIAELAPELGWTRADPGQIEQVIVNLSVNARDAMPVGGRLTIQTGNAELDESYAARHIDVSPGPHVRLTVSDTGTGMSDEILAHIYEPFFTTKPEGQGTGMGLATVYGIVKQSDGHIEVSSEVGRGTTFHLYLPRVEQETGAMDLGQPPRAPNEGTETVFVVEDEPMVRQLTCRILDRCGYEVLETGEPDQALRHVAQRSKPLHLLIADVVMPGIGGKALADRVRALHPETKVLYISGYTSDAIVEQTLADAAAHFLQKPFTSEDLARKVRQVLDGSS